MRFPSVQTLVTCIALATVGALPGHSRATVLMCDNAHYSVTRAHVLVAVSDRDAFIKFIEGGLPDPLYPLKPGGAVETDKDLSLFLNNFEDGAINVMVENKKSGSEFVIWMQTCNTTRSWRPYWRVVLTAARQRFPAAKVWETPLR